MAEPLSCEYSPENIPDEFRRLRSLWAEVLRRAIDDSRMPGRTSRIARENAKRWIESSNSDEFNSFESVCRFLDLDPDRVRQKLKTEIAHAKN